MVNIIKKLETKINNEFKPKKIQIINKSHLHIKHKSFDINKVHLRLIIHSTKLREMKSIDAHKMIYSFLRDEMKNNIHALEIEIR